MFAMKAYSSTILLLSLITLLIFPLSQTQLETQDYLDIVTKSFQATDAEFDALIIEAWAQISKKGLVEKDLEILFKQLTNTFSIPYLPIIDTQYPEFIGFSQQETVADGQTVIYATLQSVQPSRVEAGTYLGLSITTFNLQEAQEYYKLVIGFLSPYTDISNIGITITGTIPGKLSQKQTYQLFSKAFKTVGAEIKEGINTPELVSLSAYTPRCPYHLKVNDKKINLNLAARYHYFDNKTYLHFGAPLIFQEY